MISRPLALSALVVACGGGVGDAPSAPGGPAGTNGVGRGSLPCEVDTLLASRCRSCHSDPPQYGAPMSLVSYADVKNVGERIVRRIDDDARPMPPSPNPRLTEAERKTLRDWVAGGARAGTEACSSSPSAVDPTLKCNADVILAPAEPWTMPTDSKDEYVCWGVDLTRPQPTHIVGFAPQIDNKKIVHHVVLYESPVTISPKPQACPSGGSIFWRMVFGWAPGSQALELPPEAGFPIATRGATHYVVQMHYSNTQRLEGEKDASKMALCSSAPRANEADVIAFGTQDIRLAARPPEGGIERRICSITVPQELAGLHLFTAMPHMHKLGVEMWTVLKRTGSPDIDLGTMPAFDFNNQTWLPINATTATNDVITTTCGWRNTTGESVRFGEETDDEMCYSFTMYYPKVRVPLFSWVTPSLLSRCQ
jgi:hypothetical protein